MAEIDIEEDTQVEREYVCEVCGKTEKLDPEDAYLQGWDYPPFIGTWGVVSPRTCEECPMTDTAWWEIISGNSDSLSDKHKATIARIIAEGTDGNGN